MTGKIGFSSHRSRMCGSLGGRDVSFRVWTILASVVPHLGNLSPPSNSFCKRLACQPNPIFAVEGIAAYSADLVWFKQCKMERRLGFGQFEHCTIKGITAGRAAIAQRCK